MPLTAATSSGQGRLARTAGGEVAAPAGETYALSRSVGAHPAEHALALGPAPRSGASPPVPHDPDRTIGDWWAAEPDPRVPPWHLVAVAVPPAALWGLLLVGLPGRVALGLLAGAVAAAVWVGTAPARARARSPLPPSGPVLPPLQ